MMQVPSGDGGSRRWPRWDAIAREVAIPAPFTLEAFGRALERRRGRPLTLVAIPLLPGRHATWVETASRDYILYEPFLPLARQVRAIAHQAGHMCGGHRGVASGTMPAPCHAARTLEGESEEERAARIRGRGQCEIARENLPCSGL